MNVHPLYTQKSETRNCVYTTVQIREGREQDIAVDLALIIPFHVQDGSLSF